MPDARKTPRALRWGALFVWVLWLATGTAAADGEIARVVRVYDGDSLWLADGREVRLIGINAPELGRDGTPDQPLARAARDRTNLLVRGKAVRLVYDAERFDHYGRTLAYVVLPDGRDLQEILARDGLAWFVAIAPNVTRRDTYRHAEAEARAANRGIWSRPEYLPIAADRLSARQTGFQRISGTVKQVDEHGDWVLLRLAPGIALTIARSPDFPAPEHYAGKRVLARGWVTEYKNELRMRITDPAMLEELP